MRKSFVLWALLLTGIFPLHGSPMEEADALLKNDQPDAAVEKIRSEVQKNQADPYMLYNLGLTLYRAGRYDEAIQTIQDIDPGRDRNLEAKCSLQLGNIQFRLAQELARTGQPVGAVLSMERSLGYFESANAIKAGKESKTNQEIATAQLEKILLQVADSALRNAELRRAKDNLRDEERLLQNALQASQRALELRQDNTTIPPRIEEATTKLIRNLAEQGNRLGKEADAEKKSEVIIKRRENAIAKYDEALLLAPDDVGLTKARTEQAEKLATLLTLEAEELSAEALKKPDADLKKTDQDDLEKALDKLDHALALDPAAPTATRLQQKILKKLESSYVQQGQEALGAMAEAPTDKKKLELAQEAIAQFEKALAQNPENESAQKGLETALAQLPSLLAAAGEEALENARELHTEDKPTPADLSNDELKKSADLLNEAVQDLDQASSLQPEEKSYQVSLEQAQKLLDAANDEAAERAAKQQGKGQSSTDGEGQGAQEKGALDGGKLLPLTYTGDDPEPPLTEEKFWNNKIKDW